MNQLFNNNIAIYIKKNMISLYAVKAVHCIKRSPLGQRKGDLLIEVTALAGLTVVTWTITFCLYFPKIIVKLLKTLKSG